MADSQVLTHRTLIEQETVIRFDRTPAKAIAYTADPGQAARWRKLGWDVKPIRTDGWQAEVPKNAIAFRKLVNGETVKREVSPEAREARRKLLSALHARRQGKVSSHADPPKPERADEGGGE